MIFHRGRFRAVIMAHSHADHSQNPPLRPSRGALWMLFLASAIPFIGFGFLVRFRSEAIALLSLYHLHLVAPPSQLLHLLASTHPMSLLLTRRTTSSCFLWEKRSITVRSVCLRVGVLWEFWAACEPENEPTNLPRLAFLACSIHPSLPLQVETHTPVCSLRHAPRAFHPGVCRPGQLRKWAEH